MQSIILTAARVILVALVGCANPTQAPKAPTPSPAPTPTRSLVPDPRTDRRCGAHGDAYNTAKLQGLSLRQIAREPGIARNTVRRYARHWLRQPIALSSCPRNHNSGLPPNSLTDILPRQLALTFLLDNDRPRLDCRSLLITQLRSLHYELQLGYLPTEELKSCGKQI